MEGGKEVEAASPPAREHTEKSILFKKKRYLQAMRMLRSREDTALSNTTKIGARVIYAYRVFENMRACMCVSEWG